VFINAVVQKIALTAIVDQADNFNLEATRAWTHGQARALSDRFYNADAPPQVTQEGGDDRVSISHNGSSEFAGNADSAETADVE